MLRVGALLLGLLAPAPHARANDILDALRADRWTEAEALAALHPDPVARKIVLHARLLTPGAAGAAEIADFMAASPDWPQQTLLSRRLQEAVGAEGSILPVLDACARRRPDVAAPLLGCAEAARGTQAFDPARAARQSWIDGVTDPAAETAFLRQWGRSLTAADHQARFERLIWADTGARGGPAARQAARLSRPLRAAAERHEH